MTYREPTDEEVERILRSARRIAIVGISEKKHRASYQVALYLQRAGYEIVPVNPELTEVLGVPAAATLSGIKEPVDIVNVFRRPEHTPDIAREAAAMGAKTFWMQLQVVNEEAARIAAAAGMNVVMDRCSKIEHARLIGQP
ncbi:CoA-binding protein [Candidatus Poribacteria bacterium]|nr:CoA-binding protein [Candidatus Poribacteria bacterium]